MEQRLYRMIGGRSAWSNVSPLRDELLRSGEGFLGACTISCEQDESRVLCCLYAILHGVLFLDRGLLRHEENQKRR